MAHMPLRMRRKRSRRAEVVMRARSRTQRFNAQLQRVRPPQSDFDASVRQREMWTEL